MLMVGHLSELHLSAGPRGCGGGRRKRKEVQRNAYH